MDHYGQMKTANFSEILTISNFIHPRRKQQGIVAWVCKNSKKNLKN